LRTTAYGPAIEESARAENENDLQHPSVEQNYPNPSAGITTIECFVPDNPGDARIVVYNMSGIIVHQCPIAGKGNSSVSLDLQNLPSGIYFYGLTIDGNVAAEKKRLILIK
jgi:hypothetical protein